MAYDNVKMYDNIMTTLESPGKGPGKGPGPASGPLIKQGLQSWRAASTGTMSLSAGAPATAMASGTVAGAGTSKWDIVRRRLTPEAKMELANKRVRRASQIFDAVMTPARYARVSEARSRGQRNRVERLINRMDAKLEGWTDNLLNEVYLISHDAFDFFTPSKASKYPIFTMLFLVINIAVFTAMAAEFPWYQTQIAETPFPDGFMYRYGPSGLRDFITYDPEHYSFSAPYLVLWGGRYNPAIRDGDDHRWFTSLLVHSSFQHISSNMLLFVSLAAPLVGDSPSPLTGSKAIEQ